jgi:predicted aldo/keto reductase-like oxidoreductase
MKDISSRRNFLAAGLALPAAALASSKNPSWMEPSHATLAQTSSPKLSYRVLGKTGLKITSVGFGCMITSDQSVIEKAADLGINYFDTARGYQQGNNERMVGAALKSKRKDLIISTKTGAGTKEEALNHLSTSLKELGTDYVDIWHLHARSKPEQLTDQLMEAQQIAKKEGKVRFVGVSTHGGQPELIPAIISKLPHFDVILTAYNFTMDPAMDSLIESATKAGIGIIAMKVMAGGFRRAKPGDKVYDTLKREGAMLAALKWVLKNPNVHTTVPSITDMEQLNEDMRAMSLPFTETDKKTLSAHLDYLKPLYCRMCGRCDGKCPQGLPVADILRFLSYSEGYGQFQLARESYLQLPADARDVRCSSCSSCAIQCPNGVQVANRLITAQELLA